MDLLLQLLVMMLLSVMVVNEIVMIIRVLLMVNVIILIGYQLNGFVRSLRNSYQHQLLSLSNLMLIYCTLLRMYEIVVAIAIMCIATVS